MRDPAMKQTMLNAFSIGWLKIVRWNWLVRPERFYVFLVPICLKIFAPQRLVFAGCTPQIECLAARIGRLCFTIFWRKQSHRRGDAAGMEPKCLAVA